MESPLRKCLSSHGARASRRNLKGPGGESLPSGTRWWTDKMLVQVNGDTIIAAWELHLRSVRDSLEDRSGSKRVKLGDLKSKTLN